MGSSSSRPHRPPPPPPPPHYYHHHQQPYYGPPRPGNGYWYPPPPPPRPAYGPGFWFPGAGGPPVGPPLPPPMPLVEHQKATMVKNGVNVHKDTLKLVVDEGDSEKFLVSFTFDALLDGCVTIYYFAREGENCHFSPYYDDLYAPNRVHFVKGPAQKFVQPSGSGIDLGFFSLEELSQPMNGDIFPLVVYAETSELSPPTVEQAAPSSNSSNAQITLAVIENNNGVFHIKVVKQILWVNGQRYELQDIFGLANSVEPESNSGDDSDQGKDCVICLSEPRDTLVFPCRHMCLCSECAKELRLQSNKCPICRQPIERLMEMKVNSADS